MEWAEYKTLCDRPDYQSKWLIKQTLELVRAMGVEEVIAVSYTHLRAHETV